MKTNLFKTKVLVWMLLIIGLFGNYTFGQTTVVQFTPTLTGVTWTLPAGFTEFDIEIWGQGANGQYDGGSGGADGGGGGGYLKIAGLKHVAFITYYKVSQTSSNPGYTGINLYDNTNDPIGVLKAFSPKPTTPITGGTVNYPSELIYTSLISENGGNGDSGTGQGGNGGKGGGTGGGAGGTPTSPDGKAPGGGGVGRAENGSEFPGEGGAGLVRITYTIPPSITTTFNQVAPICKGAPLAALPTTSTNTPMGITGTWSPSVMNNMATTTYIFTPTPGQDASTATMTIEVNAPTAPTTSTPQSFCQGQKVADLVATGTALKWYNAASGGSELAETDVLTATTYYVSQTVNGCGSDRTPVLVKFNPAVLTATLAPAATTACTGSITVTAPSTPTSYTNTFPAAPTGPTSTGFDASWESGSNFNFIKLTADQTSKKGYLYITDAPAYSSIRPNYLELNFRAFMLNKSGADGFSLNISPNINVNTTNSFENGILLDAPNNLGVVIRFKTFNQDVIELVHNGTVLGTVNNYTLEDGNWKDYKVTIKPNNTLTLVISGTPIFDNIAVTGYTNLNPNIAFAARTGGSSNDHIIDDVVIKDLRPYEYSVDNATWQSTNIFTNKTAGSYTVYGRLPGMTCGNALGNVTVTGLGTPPTPTFTPIATICKGATLDPLPTTSTNGYTGTWEPALNNMATTTYTFTPAAGQCASTATMTITVKEPVTPTFKDQTVVFDKNSSNRPSNSQFIATIDATYRIELWGKGGISQTLAGGLNPGDEFSGGGGGYTAKEVFLPRGTYTTDLFDVQNFRYTFFLSSSAASRLNSETTNVTPQINLRANNGFYNIGGTASGGEKNITGGNGKKDSGGGAAGWWFHNGASLDGTATAGGVSGTPDNSSDGGAPGEDGVFPGGGGGAGNANIITKGADGRILITKIDPIITTYCKGATIKPLPTTSVEGITGTWSPSAMNNMATTTYTFTPTAGQCANTTTLEIVINELVTPTFTQVEPICKGASLAALPTTSTNNIAGTWSPSAMNNMATTTYTFTPAAGVCTSTVTMTIVVKDFVAPTFTQIAPICNGSTVPVLPSTSLNGVTGTWVPAVINNQATTTYTFTANAGECASSTATMNIEVKAIVPLPDVSAETALLVTAENDNIGSCPPDYRGVYGNLQFTPIGNIYRNINESLESPYYMVQDGSNWFLRFSRNGNSFNCFTINAETSNPVPPVNGWLRNPEFDCTTNSIMVNAIKRLSFCEGATVSDLKLKFFRDNNNLPIFKFYDATNIPIYTENTEALKSGDVFATQTIGGCESAKLPIQITIQQPITPTFIPIGPICKGASSPLPPTSDNNINGTWSPSFSSETIGTTTYTFTPAAGVCASTTTISIEITNCSVISGIVYEDADGGTIDGTPLTVDGAYLSIYKIYPQGGTAGQEPLHIVPVTKVTGAYTFPALPHGRYLIVIGTSPDGSETASYPNVGNYSMTAAAEGEAGTMGDGAPDGFTFVTVSDGATTYDGGNDRVRADAGVSFALKQLAPLPVRLISFTGKNTEKVNELNWKTASETNFSHFDVERSTDAKKFEKIGELKGNKAEIYEFIDKNSSFIIHHSSLFYRLKMVDLDGTFAYSKIIFIENEMGKNIIGQVYPNPSNGVSKVKISTNDSGNWTVNTFDITGKLIGKEIFQLQKGLNQIELKKLSTGLNYIQMSDGKTTEVRKVIKN